MFERFTDSARRTVVLAQEEARMLNYNYVGTEHLLLALTHDKGPAGQTLTELGVTHQEAQGHVVELIGEGIAPVPGHIPFLPSARTVLQMAMRCALSHGVDKVDSGHVLQSLLTHDPSVVPVAVQTIVACGTTPDAVAALLTELMTTPYAPMEEPEPRFVLSA